MLCPLDYSLCDRTVTVYRLENGAVSRWVVDNAWYSWQVVRKEDELGSRQETLFSLILPGQHTLQAGDRIYDGVGPQITMQAWTGFLPVHVAGLAEVQYVKPCYFMGQLCHTEAGRK